MIHKIVKFSLRNVFRNKRRTLLTISIFVVSFMILALYSGYINNTKKYWKISLIHGEYGHLQIASKAFFDDDQYSLDNLIPAEVVKKLSQSLEQLEQVEYFTTRVFISGFIGNEERSKVFVGSARAASENEDFYYTNPATIGTFYSKDEKYGVVIGKSLADALNVKVNDKLLLMANSALGSLEAIEVQVTGLSKQLIREQEKVFLILNDEAIEELTFSQGRHNIVILLSDINETQNVARQLQTIIDENHFPVELRTLDQLAQLFNQVMDSYQRNYIIALTVLSLIIVLSLINTMYMSITDRMREFTTLKTIGISNSIIFLVILFEGIEIALFGTAIGAGCAFGISELINANMFMMPPPPGTDQSFPLRVMLDPPIYGLIGASLFFVSIVASLVPAYSVLRKEIQAGFHAS